MNSERKILRYDSQTGEPIYEDVVNNQISNINNERKILRYDTQTGEPIYEDTINQPMSNQPMSNQSMNNQSMNNQPMSNQPMSNQSMNNQPMNNQPMSNQSMINQPMNNQSMNNQSMNNKKSLNIIISILIIVIVAIVTAIVVILLVRKPSTSSQNEYENNNTNNSSNVNNNNNNNSSNTIVFQGFEIPKMDGYIYSQDDDNLEIYSNSYYFNISIFKYNINQIKSSNDEIKNTLINQNIEIVSSGFKTVLGKEVVYFEITKDTYNGLIYYFETSDSSYSYEIVGKNNYNDFDESIINESINLLSSAKYVGNYSNYSATIDFDGINLNK